MFEILAAFVHSRIYHYIIENWELLNVICSMLSKNIISVEADLPWKQKQKGD